MTTLTLSSDAEETLPFGSYDITETSGYQSTNVALNFETWYAVLHSDAVYGAPTTGSHSNQTLNFDWLTSYDVNIAWNGSATFNGWALDNVGSINVIDANVTMDTALVGTGMTFLQHAGAITTNGYVAPGQTFEMGAGSTLNIGNP
ncbi:MAG: hypothetical protein JO122_18715, partial [Acetobacteraceae bacterium]|nr:hypothetical protein [Acetobacteraceae bacterium]